MECLQRPLMFLQAKQKDKIHFISFCLKFKKINLMEASLCRPLLPTTTFFTLSLGPQSILRIPEKKVHQNWEIKANTCSFVSVIVAFFSLIISFYGKNISGLIPLEVLAQILTPPCGRMHYCSIYFF